MIEDANPCGLFRLTPLGMAVSAPMAQPAKPASAPSGSAAPNGDSVKTIIANNSCLSCHRIGADGGEIGPSLNGVGTRRTPDQIQAAIVSPPKTTSAGAPALPTFVHVVALLMSVSALPIYHQSNKVIRPRQ